MSSSWELHLDGIKHKILRRWQIPPQGIRQAESTREEMRILFEKLPPELSEYCIQHFGTRLVDLNEIYLQLGQFPECIFADPHTGQTHREALGNVRCEQKGIDLFSSFFLADESTGVASSKRKGISQTLHRVSLITHPMRNPEKVIGVAVRVGRAMQGLLETMAWKNFLTELAEQRHSLLIIGKPGVGKTTVLREMACILSANPSLNVVVVDKTCELAGDGDVPHRAIGTARWMPVGKPHMQHMIMREAVENQSPDVIIVDEISTPEEVNAAKTIAQRGVQLIATVHGHTLPEIINCKERGSLVGGITSVTISGREADRRADKRKQVLKRSKEPIFTAALELHHRDMWYFHPNIKDAADQYLDGQSSDAMELHPGAAVAVKSIPGEGCFEYCRECGMGYTCNLHLGAGYASQGGISPRTASWPPTTAAAAAAAAHSPARSGKRRGGKGGKKT